MEIANKQLIDAVIALNYPYYLKNEVPVVIKDNELVTITENNYRLFNRDNVGSTYTQSYTMGSNCDNGKEIDFDLMVNVENEQSLINVWETKENLIEDYNIRMYATITTSYFDWKSSLTDVINQISEAASVMELEEIEGAWISTTANIVDAWEWQRIVNYCKEIGKYDF